jgi:enoyl-CoA hydratase
MRTNSVTMAGPPSILLGGETMAYENLLYEVKDQIARITFNRPNVLNALNRKTVEELGHGLNAARQDDSVRVLILTGAGEKAFIAGADINELAQRTPIDGKDFSLFGQEIIHRLETMGKPSIAAINGFALGGGCELALACTIRIASRNARLGQPEVKLGILPGYGGSQRLPRLCGKGLAHELILTGEMISADEALRIGLVNRVFDSAELLSAAETIAKKIIANAPLAVKYAMEAIEHGMEVPQEEGLFLEATLFGLCCATEDMREGTRAFIEKRPAKFQGR